MTLLKLYRGDDVVGILSDPSQDGPQFMAAIELTAEAAKHQELIDYISTPNRNGDDPPEHLRVFDDWFIELKGEKIGIFLPGIISDGKFLSWRWKRPSLTIDL